jgi:ABC-type polysaccharide/polyol phosphate export permease
MAITHEFEGRTIVQWQLAPVGPGWLLAGKLAAAAAVGAVANAAAAAVVIFGYRVPADHIFEVVFALGLAVIIFTAFGAAVGTLLKRTLPVAALFFGLALPFYLVSGAIEPVRFDGETLYTTAHMSPVYSVVTLVENGFHDLRVAPETIRQSVIVLVLWTIVAVLIATALLHRKFARQ